MLFSTILGSLCTHDPRNPDRDPHGELNLKPEDCYCDNCFYGRTALAEELLRLRKLVGSTEFES